MALFSRIFFGDYGRGLVERGKMRSKSHGRPAVCGVSQLAEETCDADIALKKGKETAASGA